MEFPAFVVVETRPVAGDGGTEDADAVFAPWSLTPRVMRWSDSVWLMDLRPAAGYWQACALRHGRSGLELLTTVLRHAFPGGRFVRAAFSMEAWRATLLWVCMHDRNVEGILAEDGPFGRSLYEGLSWRTWLSAARLYGIHAAAVPTSHRDRFDPIGYRQRLEQLSAAAGRLRLKQPGELKSALPTAMRRRFGRTVALLWDWSFPRGRPNLAEALPSGFPWISYEPPATPRITRHLEHALWRWEEMEPVLAEDLGRLTRHQAWRRGERVTSLSWRLTLHDMSTIDVAIEFRHPHDLHAEAIAPRTALLRASYAFEAAAQEARRLREVEAELPIIGWDLAATSRLIVPVIARDLFGEWEAGEGSQAVRLLELENRLPVPLLGYDLRTDWLPETSFAPTTSGQEDLQDRGDNDMLDGWLVTARCRPLLMYRKPKPFPNEPRLPHIFLERIGTKWWESVQPEAGRRDYYRVQAARRHLWVYRDEQGEWYEHGVFA